MKRYFNTTFGISMAPDGLARILTVSPENAARYLSDPFENIANPGHGNTLDAVSGLLGIDVRNAKGGRVRLSEGDQCLVAEVGNLPPQRETRQYSDEEIKAATFTFRIVTIKIQNGAK